MEDLNEMQARDWMFRCGVDTNANSWRTLWRTTEDNAEATEEDLWIREVSLYPSPRCPGCRCGNEQTCRGKECAGLLAQDAVTCWKCKNFFDGRCVPGFEIAMGGTDVLSFVEEESQAYRHLCVEMEGLHADLDREQSRRALVEHELRAVEERCPGAESWRRVGNYIKDVGILLKWGQCPLCGAELGASCLPKNVIVEVGRKVYDLSVLVESNLSVLRRVFAVEAGYSLQLAYDILLNRDDPDRSSKAIEACTRTLTILNTARSISFDLYTQDLVDLYFRAHFSRACLERSGNVRVVEKLFQRHARYETTEEFLPLSLLTRSQVVGECVIVGGLLEGIPAALFKPETKDDSPPSEKWWPKSDPAYEASPDSEHIRRARLFQAIANNPYNLVTMAPGIVVMAFDARWFFRSAHAAHIFWTRNFVKARTHENEQSDFQMRRLKYSQTDAVLCDDDDEDPSMPVAIAGTEDSRVYRSKKIVQGTVAFNCIFRINRVCAKLYILVDLEEHAAVDPNVTIGVLALAATAASNLHKFLTNHKANRLVKDLPDSLIPEPDDFQQLPKTKLKQPKSAAQRENDMFSKKRNTSVAR